MPQDEQDFGAILAAFESEQEASRRPDPRVGEKVEGRVLTIGEDTVFVDLGAKSEGAVPRAELVDEDGDLTVGVGDEVEALVVAVDDDTGTFLLRVRPGQAPAMAAELAQAQAHGIPVEGTVTEAVKGGVSVTVGGLRAFCPISQLDSRYVEDPAAWVGQRLSFKVTRFEQGRGHHPNVVLSRRALLEEEARQKAAETRERLEVGAVMQGVVTSLTSYGAFVDLGGLEGLLHVSQLGHSRVEHPKDVLTEGQQIEVEVLKIEPPKEAGGSERISLSRRSLMDDPWPQAVAKMRPATRHSGKVARLEKFGAFVELAPGVDGLLHVSELGGDRRVGHPREVLEVGQPLEVTIVSIDTERRRISLTLREPEPEPSAEDAAKGDPGGFGSLAAAFEKSREKG